MPCLVFLKNWFYVPFFVVLETQTPLTLVSPTIVVPPRNTTSRTGLEVATFECVINARPINDVSIRWYRLLAGDQRISIEHGSKYVLSEFNRKVDVKTVTEDDAGVYECVATWQPPANGAAVVVSAQASLIVQSKRPLSYT